MKRYSAVIVVLMAAFLAICIAGCGNDTEKAREYVVEADTAYSNSNVARVSLQDSLVKLQEMMQSGDPAQMGELPHQIEKVEEQVSAYEAKLSNALSKYNELDSLSGVQDYQTYKKMMTNVIQVEDKIAGNLMEVLEEAKNKIENGEPLDQEEINNTVDDLTGKWESASKLEQEAKAFEIENGLN